MLIVDRTLTFVRGFLMSYGPPGIKKRMWDKEFSGEKWNFIDNTLGDCVYPHLEKYAQGGDILDLGCGPGNTANELSADAYGSYIGVDISEAALAKAGLPLATPPRLARAVTLPSSSQQRRGRWS